MKNFKNLFLSKVEFFLIRLIIYLLKKPKKVKDKNSLLELTELCKRDEKFVSNSEDIYLPKPSLDTDFCTTSLQTAIDTRISTRNFAKTAITLQKISVLLYCAAGKRPSGTRPIPSAGGLYPYSLYLFAFNIDNLSEGIYGYNATNHSLVKQTEQTEIELLKHFVLTEQPITDSAFAIAFSAEYFKTCTKYGQRGLRYVFLDVGHAMQNAYLAATALNIGIVSIGGYEEQSLNSILHLDGLSEGIVYLCVGGNT